MKKPSIFTGLRDSKNVPAPEQKLLGHEIYTKFRRLLEDYCIFHRITDNELRTDATPDIAVYFNLNYIVAGIGVIILKENLSMQTLLEKCSAINPRHKEYIKLDTDTDNGITLERLVKLSSQSLITLFLGPLKSRMTELFTELQTLLDTEKQNLHMRSLGGGRG